MALFIWLLGVVDGISAITAIATFIFGAGWIVLKIISTVTAADQYSQDVAIPTKKLCKTAGILFLVVAPIALFLPDSKTIAAMYLIPKIVENKAIQDLPNKALEALNLKMDQWIQDLGSEKKDKK